MIKIPFDANSIGANTIIAPVQDKYLDIWMLMFQASVASVITLKSGTTPLTGSMQFVAGGSWHMPYINSALFRVEMNEAFVIHLAGLTGGCAGWLMYEETT